VGAGQLLLLRGLRQFESPLGHQLFVQVSSNIRVSSAQRQVPVPPHIIELHKRAQPFLDSNDQTLRFSLIVDSFATLRASLAEQKHQDPAVIIQSALRVEEDVCEMMSTLPSTCQFAVVTSEESTGAYGDTFHLYPSNRVAQRWNSLRMMSIFVNEMIYKQTTRALKVEVCPKACYNGLTYNYPAIREQCVIRGAYLAEQICASVPQFANTSPSPTVSVVAPLLWPLAAAGESDLSPPSVRDYVISKLHFLGKQARVPQASWAAQMLEESKKLEDWYVITSSSLGMYGELTVWPRLHLYHLA
jgi:hypothetical protein